MTTMQQRDLIEVLVQDHREVEEMFAELETGRGDVQRRQRVTSAVIAELVRHSVAEEEYLYPTVRRVLPDGDKVADQEIAEHAEAERTMKELEGLDPGEERFERALGSLTAEVRHHIREEEGDVLPRLAAACSAEELRELGRKVERAKKVAPTRPHPSAPDTPPANKLLAPGTGLVDRIRDALTGRATSKGDL